MSKLRKILIVVAVLVGVYAVLGFVVLPQWIHKKAESLLQSEAVENVELSEIQFNPFTLTLTAGEASIRGAEDKWSVRGTSAIIDLSIESLFTWHPVFDVIRLESPRIRFVREDSPPSSSETTFLEEWERLVEKIDQPSVPKLTIERLAVTGGRVEYIDKAVSSGYSETFIPVEFTLSNFTTKVEDASNITLNAQTDTGAELKWQGRLSTEPFTADGILHLSAVGLSQLSPYYSEMIGFRIQSAVLDAKFNYVIRLPDPGNFLRLHNGSVTLDDVRCLQRGPDVGTRKDNEFLSSKQAHASGVEYRFPVNQLNIEEIRVDSGQTRIWREEDGSISLLQLMVPPDITDESSESSDNVETTDAAESGRQALTYQIDHVLITDYALVWKESVKAGSPALKLIVPEASGRNISSDHSKPIRYQAEHQLESGAFLKTEGEIILDDLVVDLALDGKSIPVTITDELIGKTPQFLLKDGQLNFDGRVAGNLNDGYYLTGEGSIPSLSGGFTGNPAFNLETDEVRFSGLDLTFDPFTIALDSLILKKPNAAMSMKKGPLEASANWKSLRFSELDLRLSPLSISLGSIVLDQPKARIKKTEITSSDRQTQRGQSRWPEFQVDLARIINGEISYLAQGKSSTVELPLQNISLAIRDFDLQKADPASLSLDASIPSDSSVAATGESAEPATVSAQGSFQPKSLATDLSLKLNSISLAASTKFFELPPGLTLDDGLFSFDGNLTGSRQEGYTIRGAGKVQSLGGVYRGNPEVDLSWENLRFSELALQLNPLTVAVGTLILEQPISRIIRTSTSTSTGEVSLEEDREETSAQWSALAIDNAQIQNGRIIYVDQTTQPQVDFPIDEISFSLLDLDMHTSRPARIRMTALIPEGTIAGEGRILPMEPKQATELELRVEKLRLEKFSPYAAQGMGRAIESGLATFESDLTIDGGQLDASNAVIIRRLELGESTEGSSSLVPVGFLINMLQGPGGKIDFTLPISGDLSKPDVNLSSAIRSALSGYVKDLATSPFRILSSIFGGDEDISKVDFEAGDAALSEAMHRRLHSLAGALDQRPQLKLRIIPKFTSDDERELARRTAGVELPTNVRDKNSGGPDTEAVRAEAELLRDVTVPEADKKNLSARRAEQVRNHLIEVHGINQNRIRVSGFEESEGPSGIRFELN